MKKQKNQKATGVQPTNLFEDQESSFLNCLDDDKNDNDSKNSHTLLHKTDLFIDQLESPNRPLNPPRKRIKSMDTHHHEHFKNQISETLIGAIVMTLKTHKSIAETEIVKRIEPIFNLLKKEKQSDVFLHDVQKNVQLCLKNFQNKIFVLNEKTQKWSLREDQEINNYFASLESKLENNTKTAGKKMQFDRLRQRTPNEYSDVIEKLVCCLNCIGKNQKLAKIIRKNPFKKIRKLKLTSNKTGSFEEEVLAEILTLNASMNEERFIGIMQSFYFFLPLLRKALKSPLSITGKFVKTMDQMLEKLKRN